MAEKRKSKTFNEKYKIIKFVEEHPNMTKKDVTILHNMKPRTFNDVLKNKEKQLKQWKNYPMCERFLPRHGELCRFINFYVEYKLLIDYIS